MSETLVLIVLAVGIILIGIGMTSYRRRLAQIGGIASVSAAYVTTGARNVGGYLGRTGRNLRHRLPRPDPEERLIYLRTQQHRYEEIPRLGEPTGPITDLLGVVLNVAEYFAIGRYLRRKHEREQQPPSEPPTLYGPSGQPLPPSGQPPTSRKGRKK